MNIFRRNHEGLVSGDAIPLYHNGVFHIFYLTSPPNTVNWPERIRTTWQHAITKDLINWQSREKEMQLIKMGVGPDLRFMQMGNFIFFIQQPI